MDIVHFIPPSQRKIAMAAAQADNAPLLILGSSGTGKGAMSKWIHKNGPRSAMPIIYYSLDHSVSQQIAEGRTGTLVINEIGSLNRREQKSLLDYLNTKTVPHPNGTGTPMLVDTRIVATSSQALEGRAQAGLFNVALLEKLNVFRIEMPDLDERKDEFEDIASGILSEITHEIHKEHIKGFSESAWETLSLYHWPGNIRELRNVLRMAVLHCKGDKIEQDDLPEDFDQAKLDFQGTREEFEKIYISELLKNFNWQIDKTCQVSRINKATLLEKIKKYGIDVTSRPSAL